MTWLLSFFRRCPDKRGRWGHFFLRPTLNEIDEWLICTRCRRAVLG